MGLRDREYMRETPRWHAGADALARPVRTGGSALEPPDRTAPPSAPAQAEPRHGRRYGLCVLVALVALGLFFWGAFSDGALPVWLTFGAMATAIVFGLVVVGMDDAAKKGVETQRHAQVVDALNRR